MGIRFDDSIADSLLMHVTSAIDFLEEKSRWRHKISADTLTDFNGRYANLFKESCIIENEDRLKIVAFLKDLKTEIKQAKKQAEEETRRQARIDSVVLHREEFDNSIDELSSSFLLDLVIPSPVDVSFVARSRIRSGSSSPDGRSSAIPDRLQSFVNQTNSFNQQLSDHFTGIIAVWNNFRSACSWIPTSSTNFTTGFNTYLTENKTDTDWIQKIAEAFIKAGNGTLSNIVLDTYTTNTANINKLFTPGIPPQELLAIYNTLNLTETDIKALPLTTQIQLANLNGIPATTRNIASRAVLDAALTNPELVYNTLNINFISLSDNTIIKLDKQFFPLSLDDFKKQISELNTAIIRADKKAKDLTEDGISGMVAQLVGFGVHDNALTAAISLGNLDTASNVTINVPGATTTITSASGNIAAAEDLLKEVHKKSSQQTYAIVSWIGYHAPAPIEVSQHYRAHAGGIKLAGFIDGIYDSRTTTPQHFTVISHSYGSPTTAEALLATNHKITSFASYGSIGFRTGIHPQNLNTTNTYYTLSNQDTTARIGTIYSYINKLEDDPARTSLSNLNIESFSSENDPNLNTKGVQGHHMHPENEIGYLSPESTAFAHITNIITSDHP